MNRSIFLFLLLWIQHTTYAQDGYQDFSGLYGDWLLNGKAMMTELELRPDGTFTLRTPDHVYPQTFNDYENDGQWTYEGNEITLNPSLAQREPVVTLKSNSIGLKDSIEIKVNHFVEVYKDEKLVKKERAPFDLLTIYFNKKKHYVHLTPETFVQPSCAFAPRIKHRINIDSTSTFRIARRDIELIGVRTYGLPDFVELPLEDVDADYIELDLTIPMDVERKPRSKKVIIKGNRAFFYERKGKVDTFMAEPLTKKRS